MSDKIKVGEILEAFDGSVTNSLCDTVKLAWVNDVEGRVCCEILGLSPSDAKSVRGGEDTLCVPRAYSGMYYAYLCAMTALSKGNTYEYSVWKKEYESAYLNYAKRCIRER